MTMETCQLFEWMTGGTNPGKLHMNMLDPTVIPKVDEVLPSWGQESQAAESPQAELFFDRSLFDLQALGMLVHYREIIPFYGTKIQVSELSSFT